MDIALIVLPITFIAWPLPVLFFPRFPSVPPVGCGSGGITEHVLNRGTAIVRPHAIGLEADGCGVVLNCFVVLFEVGVRSRSSDKSVRIPGPHPENLGVVLNGFFILLKSGIRVAAIFKCNREIRIQPDRFCQITHRRLVLFEEIVCESAAIVAPRFGGIDLNNFAAVLDTQFQLTEISSSPGSAQIGFQVIRTRADGVVKMANRFRGFLVIEQAHGFVIGGLGIR